MELVSLIDDDIRRLKSQKLTSLQDDLNNLFDQHVLSYEHYGIIPGEIASGKDFTIHKVRMAISMPFRSTSKGVRLWIYFNTKTKVYFQALLYLAIDEDRKGYKSSECFKKIEERLEEYSNA
jgi:hypothetical protein